MPILQERLFKQKFDEELKKWFKSTSKFSNNDINEFVLLLRKDVYPYEYMGVWGKFYETSLSEKDDFCSNLNMENITDADYMHAKRINDLEIKH